MELVAKIGFSTSDKLLSRVIRYFTKSEVSHTFIFAQKAFFGQDMILQATMGGFHAMSYKAFTAQKGVRIIEMVELPISIDGGLEIAADWLSYHYDYGGLFGSIFILLGRWFKRKWRNPLDSSKSMYCSEATVRVLQAAGFPGADALDPPAVNPQDLRVYIREAVDKLLEKMAAKEKLA